MKWSDLSGKVVLQCLRSPIDDCAVSRTLFVRGLALIYLIAVISWWVQMGNLVGSQGLVPAADYLQQVENYGVENDRSAFFLVPTIFLLSCSDFVMNGACLLAVVLALMVIAGFFQGQGLLALWIIYLSLVTTGNAFMSFQWDVLLLEAGLLATLVAPWKFQLSWRQPDSRVPRWPWYLVRWLLFRLMFFAGYVKLTSGDSSWWDGTAMLFHYETQPLPTWTAWWMQQMPDGFNRFTCWPMLVVEIIFPFFIFMGKRMRLIAALGMAGLMLLIMATGNYTYFNWLTIVLCFSLVADQFWPKPWLKWLGIDIEPKKTTQQKPMAAGEWAGAALRGFIGLWLFVASLAVVSGQLTGGGTFKSDPTPKWVLEIQDSIAPFRSVNGYGLFRVMTKDRPEIVFEGSRDGRRWEEYRLKYKPGKLEKRPSFVAPHQPRLDWQLWFAALEREYRQTSYQRSWMEPLMLGLLDGSPEVLDFFEYQPFPDKPPKYIRAQLYLYEFTTMKERRESGNWWKRKPQGLYFPEIKKRK
ncbi:MAG: lipase maturation factor family protein [Verrucomicrobia bacterium]|nr:lipase maturation factor family protein [Verrucomicrobiota bacterium]